LSVCEDTKTNVTETKHYFLILACYIDRQIDRDIESIHKFRYMERKKHLYISNLCHLFELFVSLQNTNKTKLIEDGILIDSEELKNKGFVLDHKL
jgi:hypothetical protein